ncbi:GntR family transcriptional regulator [Achromobacter sp. UMC71]|uniref:GntR family transcriptional regulator n=1 Tax=Achromobacter sp. UMC71 TaxID=1862320 RepID=UPI002106DD9E|nr:GntR family transcriptional regulator [Achromobacter sp. UMC71]MBB1627761.1 GntR family transcriptional regulator [Achromobacter sp. UMC71]
MKPTLLGSTPLYAQVEAGLAAEIASGALPTGGQLPAEEQLMGRFGVSRTTLRKAIENLVGRGLVEIRRGKGTFVAQPRLTQELTQLTGFAEDMIVLGKNPTARLLDKRIVEADSTVAQQLNLPVGAKVYRIERLRLADGVAMSFDETYLPLDIGEKVVSHDLDVEPIFDLLENKYLVPLIEARYQLEAVTAEANVAAALGVKVGAPIFLIVRTSFTLGGKPIDYEKLFYRGDLIRFSTTLLRPARQ